MNNSLIKWFCNLTCVFIILSGLEAQEKEKDSDLFIGLGGYCNVSLFENYGVDSLYKVVVHEMQEEEIIKFTFGFQIPLKWQISKRIALSTGLQLYQYGFQSVIKDQVLWYDTITAHNDTASFYNNNSIYFIDIPASLGFNIFNAGKWDFFTEIGISGCFFVFSHYRSRIEYSDGRTNNNRGFVPRYKSFKNHFLTANARIGVDYPLTDRLSLQTSVNYKRFVFFYPLDNEEHQIKRVPYTIGLNITLFYKI